MIRHNKNYFGQVGPGPTVAALEAELAEYCGVEACVVVSSGSAALYLAAREMGFHRGPAGVCIPSYACLSLYNAIAMLSVFPRLADVDLDTFNSGCDVVIDTYGVPAIGSPDESIRDITHSIGSRLEPSALYVASFGATKPLGVGQGGCILGPESDIGHIRRKLKYDSVIVGFNFGLSDVMAGIALMRLRNLDSDNEWRRSTAWRYVKALDGERKVHGQYSNNRTWYRFVMLVDARERDSLRLEHFQNRFGIETITPIRPDELIHRHLGLDPALYPNSEEIASTTLSIPIWPGMSESDVNMVCEALRSIPDFEASR